MKALLIIEALLIAAAIYCGYKAKYPGSHYTGLVLSALEAIAIIAAIIVLIIMIVKAI
jgi:hypothetical protein